MAKNDPNPKPTATEAAIAELRLGATVQVLPVPGVDLVNNESGALFDQGVPTPQTVTTTLLRRLRDGDLTLA
ncbi:MAG: hypothetical protein K2W93_19040 [Burkholderiaceae bacterium]|nr:hypothetical protein [Burkholderiaceae bacterium]